MIGGGFKGLFGEERLGLDTPNLKSFESMSIIRKGQVEDVEKGYVIGQISFINAIFGVVA